jgi:hypothetical protein
MALIQGMENANKTRVRFEARTNGGFLEGAGHGKPTAPDCRSMGVPPVQDRVKMIPARSHNQSRKVGIYFTQVGLKRHNRLWSGQPAVHLIMDL